jgi:hypothetical protein
VQVAGPTSRNGPRPARIDRVITRVTRNVTMNASIRRSRGSFPGSTMLRSHQDIRADATRPLRPQRTIRNAACTAGLSRPVAGR